METRIITNAEYQHFLDERRTAGYHHQPDHWRAAHFPAEQGHRPVAGVRPTDAVAFCEWLTHREPPAWRYRLPRLEEGQVPLQATEESREVGFWAAAAAGSNGEEQYTCITSRLFNPALARSLSHATFAQRLEDDLTDAHAAAHNRSESRARTLAAQLDLNLDVALTRIRLHSYQRSIARDVDIDLAYSMTRRGDQFLNIAIALDHERASIIAQGIAHEAVLSERLAVLLDLDIGNDIQRAIARDLARNLAHSLEMSSTLRLYQALERTYHATYTHDLTRTKALAHALDERLERAAARDFGATYADHLTRARTLAHTFLLALERMLDRSRTTAADAQTSELDDVVRWSARICLFALASELLACVQAHQPRRRNQQRHASATAAAPVAPAITRAVTAALQPLIEQCGDLYVDSAILEERIRGRLPAFEGICVVRERTRRR